MRVSLAVFDAADDTARFALASEYLSKHPGTTLVVPAGVYRVTNEAARRCMREVMAGEHGENPEEFMFSRTYPYQTCLSLDGVENVKIEAQGATLLVEGFTEPVSIKNSKNVTLAGLAIDHLRKPYSKGTATEIDLDKNGEGSFVVCFGEEYPLCEKTPMPRCCFYDEYAAHFVGYGETRIDRREFLGENRFRFYGGGLKKEMLGMFFYVWHTFHSRPAVLVQNSENTVLENVTIHSQPGMGVVAHRCKSLTLRALNVVPSAGEHLSTNTDATHITSCSGVVRVESCRFEGQGDDALNIHTYYHTPSPLGGKKYRLTVNAPTGTHAQALDYPDEGDVLELTDRASLACLGTYTVVSSQANDKGWYADVEFDRALPPEMDFDKILFANASQCPRLEYVNNYSRSHFARGVLVKTKRALIENNSFVDVVGTAVYAAAEAYWHEGICTTEEIIIRRNRILFCGRTDDIRQRGCAGICVTVDAPEPCAPVHKSVVIEDNTVDVPDSPHAIFVSNAESLSVCRNDVRSRGEAIIIQKNG